MKGPETAQKRPLRLLLTGGGTGGHLFPAVATAESLLAGDPEAAVLFIGTRRRLDREHLERTGFAVQTIASYGLKGKRLPDLVKALAVLPLSLFQAGWRIVRFRPDVVCGVGGYVTGPVLAAAWLLRRPTLIHEQNSVPGLANRLLGRLVNRICLSLPESETYFPAGKTVLTGNPVRRSILGAARHARPEGGPRTLLILGGSQGARPVNKLVTAALTDNPERFSGVHVIHQTGTVDEQWVAECYRTAGISCTVAPFFTRMADVYSQADVVISRSGATTLAELSVLGLPALLIPYPHAADDHQFRNARWYGDNGGALVFRQEELPADELARQVLRLLADEPRRQQMSAAMRRLGIADAAERIVAICHEVAKR